MRKTILLLTFVALNLMVNSQTNQLLNGKFWSGKPSLQEVKKLVDEGNDPTELNMRGFDPTVLAILNHTSIDVLEYLLSFEDNPINKITHDARNYLMWAGMKGDYETIKFLINKGGDITFTDNKGNNLQTYTAMGGTSDPKVYELYKRSGLKLAEPNRNGGIIIHYLAQHASSIKAFSYFIKEGLDINAVDNNGSNIFHYAASQGNPKLLKQLISEGFDPKATNNLGENAYYFAARGKRGFQNKVDIFKSLEELGLKPTIVNKNNSNILHFLAASNKNDEVLSWALEKGVNPDQVNDNGDTPLLEAARTNNIPGLKTLYTTSKDKMLENKEGKSLLTHFLRSKNEEFISIYLKENSKTVNYTLIDSDGNNLLTHLVETYQEKKKNYFDRYAGFLLKNGVKPQAHTVHIATVMEEEHLLISLLKAGVDINGENAEGLTPLQISAMKTKDVNWLKFLVKNGADTKTLTEFEETIYELASDNELLKGDIEFLK